jgi:hypothetical protein
VVWGTPSAGLYVYADHDLANSMIRQVFSQDSGDLGDGLSCVVKSNFYLINQIIQASKAE